MSEFYFLSTQKKEWQTFPIAFMQNKMALNNL